MQNATKEKKWLNLNLYPAKPGYKWRAQDENGSVFDYSVKPVELSEAGYLSWDDVPDAEFAAVRVGKFEVLGNWKDMCFNLKDVAEKQRKTPLPVTNPQRINQFSPKSVDTNDILTVISFAAERHKNQRRKDKDATLYINHPLAVAKLLSDHDVTDQDTIFAALLHDVVEDTETTFEELVLLFGQSVADMVMEVTDDKSLPKAERKRLQVDAASSKSLGARLIKIADKVHNLQSMIDSPPHNWTPERINEYFDWSKQVIDQVRGANSSLEALFDSVYEACKSKIQLEANSP
jgi:guanosine-3',5'-bis(diphosphate) 3'-pyrophosphohydrolase